jgi:Tfp pilus assembly protein PilP
MNGKQNTILIIGAIALLLMLFLPPFYVQLEGGRIVSMGYGLLFVPPKWNNHMTAQVNVGQLLVQVLVVTTATGLAWLLFNSRPRSMESDPQSSSSRTNSVRPWTRFFAKQFDIMLWGLLIYGPMLLLCGVQNVADWGQLILVSIPVSIVGLFLVLQVDAFVMGTFGTTPGKALLKVEVRNAAGNRLSVREAYHRNNDLYAEGFWLGVPVLSIGGLVKSYQRLVSKGATSWDERRGFTVTHGPVGAGRVIVFVALLIAMNAGHARVVTAVGYMLHSTRVDVALAPDDPTYSRLNVEGYRHPPTQIGESSPASQPYPVPPLRSAEVPPLLKYDTLAMRVTGIVSDPLVSGDWRASLEDPSGSSVVVRVGDKVGEKNRVVKKITADRVVIEDIVGDGNGGLLKREVTLELHSRAKITRTTRANTPRVDADVDKKTEEQWKPWGDVKHFGKSR